MNFQRAQARTRGNQPTKIRFPGIPTWFSQTPGKIAGPAPQVDEHRRQVLDEYGLQDPKAAIETPAQRG